MRIAFLGTMGIPARYGGFETCVEEVATRLARDGHEVIVYCGHKGLKLQSETYKGVKLVFVPRFGSKFVDFPVRTLISTLSLFKRKVDIAHFYGSDAWPFTLLARFMKIKTVVTLDGLVWKRSSYPVYIQRLLLLTARIPFYFSNSVIVDSKSVQSWYRKNLGKSPIYVPYGAKTDKSEPDGSKLVERGLSKSKYILFVGRLVREKGVHYLVEAFNRIHTNLKLVIVGGDPYGNQYEHLLKRMANRNVIFTGNVYGKECENLYKGAYLYVSPSDLEGTSPAILTALGLRKCTLVSDIPENLETIGNAGFSFKHGDVEDLKEKLSDLLDNPDLVEGLQEKALDRINEYYNWDKIKEQLVQIYNSVIDG